SGLIVMVNKDEANIKSIDDLKGKRIACQIGTTGEKKSRSVEGAKVVAFNTQSEASMELKNGGADAVINDAPVVGYYLAQGGDKVSKTVGEVIEAEEYGIAVNKKNTQLVQDINKAMAELKKNGEFDKIYKTWFGEVKK
ncbi:MAG: transporter substrate-binding domain-containing protein, partial [Phascolarctobacterium sp.]|nr:transporter substrate-binding domain-containing protein [Phascolarctobacterium sp.]